jgi:methylmalonyl-CoA/ethylmalonyl-CoA epimerase
LTHINPQAMKVEHIGIAVKNVDSAIKIYEKLLNTTCYKTENVEDEHVLTAFFKRVNPKLNFLRLQIPIQQLRNLLNKRGEGLHHIAFEVDNIEQEMRRLENEGFRLLNKQPVKGADNKLVVFIHPKDNHGVLIELCQAAE